MVAALKTITIFAGKDMDFAVSEAARVIKDGGVAVIPTETVYGLAASAYNADAVAKIFEAKGRPADNPLIVHVTDASMLGGVAKDIPPAAQALMDAFWPGPLSIILKKSDALPPIVTGGLDTVAVRMPDCGITLKIIAAAGVPLAAPSANRSGGISPTTARHAYEDMCGRVPLIVDGGPCAVGVESTVVDVTGGSPLILRPGAVTPRMIEQVCGSVSLAGDSYETTSSTPPSPGMKYRHYAPLASVHLFSSEEKALDKRIKSMYYLYVEEAHAPVILCSEDDMPAYEGLNAWSLGWGSAEAEATLFSLLHKADEEGAGVILFHFRPEMGLAVKNRIERAAAANK